MLKLLGVILLLLLLQSRIVGRQLSIDMLLKRLLS